MQKNRILKNTILLIIGGLIVKILGFIIKILYTRYLKEEGVSLLSLILPTYTLLLTISSFQIPTIVTKLIAQNKERKSKIFFNSLWIMLLIDLILIIVTILFSNYFATNVLHNSRCAYLLKILSFTLPFVAVTSIIKAYFFGKEFIVPVVISNISEEIIKLLLIIIILRKIVVKGVFYGTVFYLFINLICEVFSFIILYIFLPKRINIQKLKYKFDTKYFVSLLNKSFPLLSSRILGSFSYFLEPIILTNLLIFKGINVDFIRLNYGYYNGYTLQILLIPSFFLVALQNNLIAPLTRYKKNNEYKKIKYIIYKVLGIIFTLSIIFIIILYIFGKDIMIVLFSSDKGYIYLRMLLPFFILFYLESPLLTFLQVFDQEKKIFKISFINMIIKYLSLTIFILVGFGFKSLIYTEILSIIVVITLCLYYLRKFFYHLS